MKLFPLSALALLACLQLSAQKPEAVSSSVSKGPVIDGVPDQLWKNCSDPIAIDKPFQDETPSLGAPGESFWEVLHHNDSDKGLYILVVIKDDVFSPAGPDLMSWEFDRPELYFDCNDVLMDGVGAGGGNGHLMIAYGYAAEYLNGEVQDGGNGIVFAHKVDSSGACWEYFIPWNVLLDKNGNQFSSQLGFDINLRDNDTPGIPGTQRAVWANDGRGTCSNESYNCMDDCGIIKLYGTCGCEGQVTGISLFSTKDFIDTDNGEIQFQTAMEPEHIDSIYKEVRWYVHNVTGRAEIDQNGILTAAKNGSVTIVVRAISGCDVFSEKEILISNQQLSLEDINLIRNGDFPEDGSGCPEAWVGPEQSMAVEQGVLVCHPLKFDQPWNFSVWQNGNNQGWDLSNDSTYILRFDAWADGERNISFALEDGVPYGNSRLGESDDPNALNGLSDWELTLTSVPITYTQHVKITQLTGNTISYLNFKLAGDSSTVYLDDIYLFTTGDYAKHLADHSGVSNEVYKAFSVFPNPVQDNLIISSCQEIKSGRYQLSDLQGRILLEGMLSGSRHSLSLAGLPDGFLLLRVWDASGNAELFKVNKTENRF